MWSALTLWGPLGLPEWWVPLRVDGRSKKRTRANTAHPIRTMGRVRSPPPPTDPLGPGTEKKQIYRILLIQTHIWVLSWLHTLTKCELYWEKFIHTFLRALYVCAVGLRLPQLEENYRREKMIYSLPSNWEETTLPANFDSLTSRDIVVSSVTKPPCELYLVPEINTINNSS